MAIPFPNCHCEESRFHRLDAAISLNCDLTCYSPFSERETLRCSASQGVGFSPVVIARSDPELVEGERRGNLRKSPTLSNSPTSYHGTPLCHSRTFLFTAFRVSVNSSENQGVLLFPLVMLAEAAGEFILSRRRRKASWAAELVCHSRASENLASGAGRGLKTHNSKLTT